MTINASFVQALRKNVSGSKARLSGNDIECRDGSRLKIASWRFFTPADPFNNKDEYVKPHATIEGSPTMLIPDPIRRRSENYVKLTPGDFQMIVSRKSCIIYAPWLYFYFERHEKIEVKGYQRFYREKWASKLDAGMCFFTGVNRSEEIPELKDKAFEHYGRIFELEKELYDTEGMLDEVDPDRQLETEYEKVQEKLMKAFGKKSRT